MNSHLQIFTTDNPSKVIIMFTSQPLLDKTIEDDSVLIQESYEKIIKLCDKMGKEMGKLGNYKDISKIKPL